ncbi:MAG: outer membrane protein assembly factor BamD [Proteobacteria bacterium]|nr:outer membrane protein assembly factor BamD [Pseudomonadota bacterium]
MTINLKKSIAFLSVFFLASCSGDEESFADKDPEVIYKQANKELTNKDFKKAAKIFSEIERNHPYSDYAINGQLLSAYSLYRAGSFEEASEAFNVFIQLHPGHSEVPYALYMRGICAYEQIPLIQRDQTIADESVSFFDELIQRYPGTEHAKDAKEKSILVKDHMAAKEMDVGIYYMNIYSYVSAINRFKTVIDDYPESRQVEEAYYRLVEAYKALGVRSQAKFYLEKLKKQFKNSSWTEKAISLMTPKTAS